MRTYLLENQTLTFEQLMELLITDFLIPAEHIGDICYWCLMDGSKTFNSEMLKIYIEKQY